MKGAAIAYNPCYKCTNKIMCEMCELKLYRDGVTIQKWISVKDRLPERFENVLCYFPEKDYGSAVMVDYNESTREEITVFASQFKWGKVTHWMPLPEPPVEEQHEKEM